MKHIVVIGLLIIAGCGKNIQEKGSEERGRIALTSLAIGVQDTARSFMLSDKSGGFILGMMDKFSPRATTVAWSIDGRQVVTDISIITPGGDGSLLSRGEVSPHQVAFVRPDSLVETIFPLEDDATGLHAMVVEVKRSAQGPLTLKVAAHRGLQSRHQLSGDSIKVWEERSGGGRLHAYAGSSGRITRDGIGLQEGTDATFLLVYGTGKEMYDVSALYARIPELHQARVDRMERLLNRAYIKTSVADLNKALYWTRLSLDALLLNLKNPTSGEEERVAIAGLPWDGAIRGRDISIAVPGIDLALGEYTTSSAVLRWLAGQQDTVPTNQTYGRIADRIAPAGRTFGGADVAPWFVRQMYEHVASSYDTTLLLDTAPAIARSIAGTTRYHVDGMNFLTHGDGETWMNASFNGTPSAPRGNRAAEIQLLWYFQQLIGGYVALYKGDSLIARTLNAQAIATARNFNVAFIDTAHHRVYDHLLPTGAGVDEVRPNALFCVDIIGPERIQQSMLKSTVNSVVHPWGVGTLAVSDPRFKPYAGLEGEYVSEEGIQNGPVYTWLTGQLIYTLSRYDRQDLTYTITRNMVERILTTDMVGTLPEVLEAAPRAGAMLPRAAGLQASLTGMAEFIRSFYQDYLGIRVDAVANQMWVQPKLPDEVERVDFSIPVGAYQVHGTIAREEKSARIVLDAPDLPKSMKIRFVWILQSGDAWKGVASLQPGQKLTLIFGSDDIVAYTGDDVAQLQSSQQLKKFSLRKEFVDIGFASAK